MDAVQNQSFILITNKFLCKIGTINSDLCSFCKSEPESITHLMWDCRITQNIINQFSQHCISNHKNFAPDKLSFLFCILSSKSVPENNIIVTFKQYLYRSRCLDKVPSFNFLLFDLKRLYATAEYISFKTNKHDEFLRLWHDWSFLKSFRP